MRLSMVILILVMLIVVNPAHAQTPQCPTPPAGTLTTTHVYGTWIAWADGYNLTYANCVDNYQVLIQETSAINYLQFDNFPLVDNLYYNTADGGKFQVNVVSGLISTITPHNFTVPPNGEGEAHSEMPVTNDAHVSTPPAAVTEQPPAYIKPTPGWRLSGKWWLKL